jgi:site-specific DNA-methyltransferase (adenine-specific)
MSEIKLILGDCLTEMRKMPYKSVDLILTDPPYGINSHSKNASRGKLAIAKDYGKCEWDKQIPHKQIFDEMFRVSKNQIIFGGNYFVEYLTNSPCWIFWDKDNGANDFADGELAYTSFKSAVRKIKWRWNGMLQEDMKHKDIRVHPTQKPVGVMKWLLNKYSSQEHTILDPFLGSGTTAVACKELNRNCIGIEISPEYYKIAEQRIRNTSELLI